MPVPTYAEYAAAIAPQVAEAFPGSSGPELILEPGIALTGNVMRFVTSIVDVKTVRSRTMALATGSIHNVKPAPHKINLPIQVIHGPHHNELWQTSGEADQSHIDIVGYTCWSMTVCIMATEGLLKPVTMSCLITWVRTSPSLSRPLFDLRRPLWPTILRLTAGLVGLNWSGAQRRALMYSQPMSCSRQMDSVRRTTPVQSEHTNVLLTCAGRRAYLARFFREALEDRGQAFAADMDGDAPALREVDDSFVVSPIDDPGYIEHLLALCQQYRVRLLVSVNDLELPLLAEHRSRFSDIGTIVVVSSPTVINTCFDKWATFEFLKQHELPAPATFTSLDEVGQAILQDKVSFPLVVKPRWGTASLCVEYAHDQEELELAYRLVHKKLSRTILAGISATDPERSVLVQEQLLGQEYVLDIVNDLDGRYVTTFVKKKLSHSMEAGGAYRTITVENPPLEQLGRTIGEQMGHVGMMDCDAFVSQGRCYALEMNPRFGGGYPFLAPCRSQRAGRLDRVGAWRTA